MPSHPCLWSLFLDSWSFARLWAGFWHVVLANVHGERCFPTRTCGLHRTCVRWVACSPPVLPACRAKLGSIAQLLARIAFAWTGHFGEFCGKMRSDPSNFGWFQKSVQMRFHFQLGYLHNCAELQLGVCSVPPSSPRLRRNSENRLPKSRLAKITCASLYNWRQAALSRDLIAPGASIVKQKGFCHIFVHRV